MIGARSVLDGGEVGRGGELGEQRVRQHPVAVGRRVEAVVAEHARGRPGTPARPGAARSTTAAPAARAALAWARAIRRPYQPPSWRSGGATARSAPRSGQVPTTTAVPPSRSRRTAVARLAAASPGRTRWVASLVPTRITARSGRTPSWARATWVARSAQRAPETATVDSDDGGTGVGQQPGQLAADGLLDRVHAHAERDRVAEQHQAQRGLVVAAEGGPHGQAEVGLGVAAGPGGHRLGGEQRGAADRTGDQRDPGRPWRPRRTNADLTGVPLLVRAARAAPVREGTGKLAAHA